MYTLEWWGIALILLVGYLIGYFFGKREASNNDEFDTKTFIELLKKQIEVAQKKKEEQNEVSEH